jgi:hypothetical protein
MRGDGSWSQDSRFTSRAVELRHLAEAIAAGRLHRILGRFHLFRCGYSALRGGWQQLAALGGAFGSMFGRTPDSVNAVPSLFEPLDINDCVRALCADGLAFGFDLPPAAIEEIHRFARRSPCTRPGRGEPFRYDELIDGRTPDGQRVAIADVQAPSLSPAIARIAEDRILLAAVAHYLGYRPGRILTRLFWSPRSSLRDDERRRLGQTIDFHYDFEGFNAIYAYFYITPSGRRSGAHVAVKTSHRRKPLGMILSSCFQSEARVLGHYRPDDVTVIEGPAGFGFLEVPQCFHRALAPIEADRLLLQIRYS